ncbi:low temperature requirement protein A [Microbacterium bovistercoris]|uniref:Low temperature requirement protein A n=1 Tax=Microbacterium bovistercoris TaxID=2293570 RepID=A0A371NXD1_9MICO|nr:low temperature requirement protein A [Microbacterium bovistercoris]REJ07348.1 low temperature requirement protein A [Microbacterium bovistercoris]
MLPRDPSQPHRAASSLELFFDLVFVVAVSIASAQLHHALFEGHLLDGIVSYLMVFFAIWWAWMNFTWFATSFDTDDWLYRVLTIVQMSGVLVLAAGIPRAFSEHSFLLLVIGYIVMRVAMVAQWLRAARSAAEYRRTALFYAGGIAVVQVLWVLFLFVPSAWRVGVFVVLVALELAVPLLAESQNTTPWHPHHITERYSLFTLIVLGETILASANAVIGALDEVESLVPLISIAVLTLISAASMWWIYFWPPHHRAITTMRSSFNYGYAHYFVLAAAAAFSVGIELQIDLLTGEGHVDPLIASFAVAIPIAVFLLAIWWVAIRANADRVVNLVVPGGAVLVLIDAMLPLPVALTTVILVAVVVVLVLRRPVRH